MAWKDLKANRGRSGSTTPREAGSGRWLPGRSANPGGKPRKNHELVQRAYEHCPEAIEFLVKIMRGEFDDAPVAPSWPVRIDAAKELLNRGLGRPAQAVTFEAGEDGEEVHFTLKIGGKRAADDDNNDDENGGEA